MSTPIADGGFQFTEKGKDESVTKRDHLGIPCATSASIAPHMAPCANSTLHRTVLDQASVVT
jgi:hypothetical protein